MIERIIDILKASEKVSDWIITRINSKSSELFFIKDKLDMNRSCQVEEYSLQVFVDFEEDGKKFKGEANVMVGSSDTDEEIKDKIDRASFSAGFVKNPWYDLPEKEDGDYVEIKAFKNIDLLKEKFEDLYRVIFKDYGYQAGVNSCEVFAYEREIRLVSSKGVDVTYPKDEFSFEIVTDSNIGKEPVEIFNGYYLKTIDLEEVERIVDKQLMETEARSKAVRNKKMENMRVILSNEAVESFFNFYLRQASDALIYQKISKAKLGENFQEKDAREKLNITIKPGLESSINARPVDGDGKRLSSYKLYEDGFVKDLVTSAKFSHYLGVENRGSSVTFEVGVGEKSLEEYMKDDYIEILTFSDFQMDATTGNFGGEFRLAKLVKDGEVSYISGGAISENIYKAQNTMVFSKEEAKRKNSVGPRAIIFDGLTVSGE